MQKMGHSNQPNNKISPITAPDGPNPSAAAPPPADSNQPSSMTAPPPPPPLLELLDDLVEEVLLRFPPDDPASLVRAALVCKRWRRLVSGRRFCGRFRGFHRTAPMLGAIINRKGFVPTSSYYHCQVPDELRDWVVLDARHGRVLFRDVPYCYGSNPPWDPTLSVWNPITGEQLELDQPEPYRQASSSCVGAVLCAATGCNHLDCGGSHGGAFLVVAASVGSETLAHVYSSVDGEWSQPIFAPHISHSLERLGRDNASSDLMPGAGVLVGGELYFLFCTKDTVLKFDPTTREMALIQLPFTETFERSIALFATEDGGLGFAGTKERKLYLWSMVAGPCSEEAAGWVQSRVIELDTILPVDALKCSPMMLRSVDVIFLLTTDGVFSVDVKSSQVKKMPEQLGVPVYVVPFMSFCTPALREASTDEEPRGGVSSA